MENDDICMNVFSRLPAKTLLGLKCICKRWQRILSDQSFIQDLLQRPESVAGFFFQERYKWCDEDIRTISYIPAKTEDAQLKQTIFSFLPEDVVILGSCNGLVCCRSIFPSPAPSMFICNPSNKQWIRLQGTTPDKESSYGLAFDPSQIACSMPINFKVLRVSQAQTDMDDSFFSFEVYSSQTGTWRKSKEICHCNHNLFKNKGVFVGGILHWLTDGDQVLSFDVENELSWLISAPFPTMHYTIMPEVCIGESEGGRLHYIMISIDGLHVWALEDYYDSNWLLVHSATLEVLEEENSELLYNSREKVAQTVSIDFPWMVPLAFKDGLLLVRVATKINLYCIKTKKMKELCDVTELGRNSIFGPSVIPYSLTLAPLT